MSNQHAPESLRFTSVQYEPKTTAFRRYLVVYGLSLLGLGLFWGGVAGLLLSLQVQQIEVAHYFVGENAGVNLAKLADLKAQVDAHQVVPSASQQHLLQLLAEYNTGKAGNLSLVTSVGAFLTMLVQPLMGTFSDHTKSRWGRRAPWILGGALVGAVLAVLLPVVPNIALLVIVWSLLGVAVGLAQGPTLTTVADRVPTGHVGRVSVVSGLLSYGAAIFGLVIAGVLFNAIGLGAYAPFALVMLITVVLFVLIARDTSSKDMPTSRLRVSTVLLSFVTALRDRDYRWAWIAKVFLWVGYGISTVYGVYMLQGYVVPALSASQAATTAPLISAAGVPAALVAMVISGRWSDKIRRRKPFVVAAALVMAASYLVPFAWPSITAMIIQSVIASFGFGMFLVVDQALFIEILPDRDAAGRDLGLSQLGANLGQAVGPIVAGVVVAAFAGSYGPVWLAASVLVLISAFAVLPIKRVR